jgi:hypothetical protein
VYEQRPRRELSPERQALFGLTDGRGDRARADSPVREGRSLTAPHRQVTAPAQGRQAPGCPPRDEPAQPGAPASRWSGR